MNIYENNYSTEIQETINKIINDINSGEMAVFCGAGISMYSGLPVVNKIVPYILEKLEILSHDMKLILDEDNNPRMPFEALMELLQENSNIDRLFDIFNLGEPNFEHIFLAMLIKSGKLKTIITTNFDRLIEKALSTEPNPMEKGKNYEIVYKEQDFEKINWQNDRIRLIKIHGSVEDKETMAITLKKVARRDLSRPRMSIIEQIFSKGTHTSVLVLGYSSSDAFDLVPQIISISSGQKKVYYIQHSKEKPTIKNIKELEQKNPFKKFEESKRLYCDTEGLIRTLSKSTLDNSKTLIFQKQKINWEYYVDTWYIECVKKNGESFKYFISAMFFLLLGSYKAAIKYFKHSLNLANKTDNRSILGKCFGNLGNVYQNMGKYQKAAECYQQALLISKELDDIRDEALWTGNLGNNFMFLGDYRKAIEYSNQALIIERKINDTQMIAARLGDIGNNFHKMAEYIKALEHYEQALIITKENGYKYLEGWWLGNIGVIYRKLGKYNKAQEYIEEALAIARNLGDIQNEGLWLGNLGNIHLNREESNKAREHYNNALTIARLIKDKQKENTWLGGLGNVLLNIGEYNKAKEYYDNALKIAIEIDDKQNKSMWLGNIGNIHLNKGEYYKAIEFYEQSLKISQSIEDRQNEGNWLGNLGSAHQNIGEFNKALKYYGQALAIAEETKDILNIGMRLGYLGIVYYNMGKIPLAIKYFGKALNFLKSILNTNDPNVKSFENILQKIL